MKKKLTSEDLKAFHVYEEMNYYHDKCFCKFLYIDSESKPDTDGSGWWRLYHKVMLIDHIDVSDHYGPDIVLPRVMLINCIITKEDLLEEGMPEEDLDDDFSYYQESVDDGVNYVQMYKLLEL